MHGNLAATTAPPVRATHRRLPRSASVTGLLALIQIALPCRFAFQDGSTH